MRHKLREDGRPQKEDSRERRTAASDREEAVYRTSVLCTTSGISYKKIKKTSKQAIRKGCFFDACRVILGHKVLESGFEWLLIP